MNLQQTIGFIEASANPFPLKASFKEIEGGGYACKMCGAKMKDQGQATTHLLEKHREMESGGPGSGRHPEGGRQPEKTVHKGENGWYWRDRHGQEYGYASTRQSAEDGARKQWSYSEEPDELEDKLEARDFSEGRRKKLAKSGVAMPGGGFPIVNKGDLANAKRAIGRAKNPAAARAHINERAKALGAKPIGAQTEFEPSMRLRMPKKAGQDTTTQNPQYTGGEPPLQAEKTADQDACSKSKMNALGLHRGGGARRSGCSSHGFHRGAGYESKARSMGHRLTLSSSALIRQRPLRNRGPIGKSFKGYRVAT